MCMHACAGGAGGPGGADSRKIAWSATVVKQSFELMDGAGVLVQVRGPAGGPGSCVSGCVAQAARVRAGKLWVCASAAAVHVAAGRHVPYNERRERGGAGAAVLASSNVLLEAGSW